MAGDDIVFQFDIDAAPERVHEIVSTADGVRGSWTNRAEITEGSEVLTFPGADAPYDFRIDEDSESRVAWSAATHPPNWGGTTISHDLTPTDDAGTTLFSRHGGFTDDPGRAIPAFIWGQIMPRLKG